MHENLNYTVIKHLAKKIKKDSHFQAITTNNGNHVVYQRIKFHIKLW